MNTKFMQYLNAILTCLGVVAFVALLIHLFINGFAFFLKYLLICGIAFLIFSLIRFLINAPRPAGYERSFSERRATFYERHGIDPSHITGDSFPSRHVFSFALIALAWFSVNWVIGAALLALAVVFCILRVFLGAHSVLDVVVAILAALLISALFYVL